MNISINPSNTINNNKIIIRPMVPGELWLLNINSGIIYSAIANYKLSTLEDDQGLYLRCRQFLENVNYIEYIKKFNVSYILFGCAKHQLEAPDCSNIIYVYDLLSDKKPINVHICNKSCDMFNFKKPPYKICDQRSLNLIFDNNDPILFQWNSKFPRPLIIRAFDSEIPFYTINDRFLQWSPPRFWGENDEIENYTEYTEEWVSDILKSFNWGYFKQAIEQKSITVEQIAATIFEIIYHEYIYFSLSRRLWGNSKRYELNKLLFKRNDIISGISHQVVINYTVIVNHIVSAIHHYVIENALVETEIDDDPEDGIVDIEKLINEALNS